MRCLLSLYLHGVLVCQSQVLLILRQWSLRLFRRLRRVRLLRLLLLARLFLQVLPRLILRTLLHRFLSLHCRMIRRAHRRRMPLSRLRCSRFAVGFVGGSEGQLCGGNPVASFVGVPAYLTQQAFGIIDPSLFGADQKLTGNPVGTGAFRVESFEAGMVRLLKNTHFDGPVPELDEIQISTLTSSDKRYFALMEGHIDACDQVNSSDLGRWRVMVIRLLVVTRSRWCIWG